jgi:hypothetical protein
LSNIYFTGGAATTCQLEIARQETLGGNLNIANGSYLRINTGINNFDLGTNTLTFTTSFNLIMLSGGINAGTSSTFVLPGAATLPASTFVNNECYNITLAGDLTLKGDLKVDGTWTGAFNIITGNNTFTIGAAATIPTLSSAAFIQGNLIRYVTNTATTFYIGSVPGTAANYYPLILQFASTGSSQAIKVSPSNVDPTIGRNGNPKNSVNALWTITPQGANISDSVKMIFQWPATMEQSGTGGQIALANASFPARWNGSNWIDYRNNLLSYTIVPDPRILTMSSYAVTNLTNLTGGWAVFDAAANTNAAKDSAISIGYNKVVITSITPTPIKLQQAFKVTVELQNQYGQPILAGANGFGISLKLHQGAATLTGSPVTALIPANQSSITLSGLTLTTTGGANHQLLADTNGTSTTWQPSLSQLFSVLGTDPATQATTISFTNVANTSMTIQWTLGTSCIVVMKADSLLTADEFPVNGTTYDANTIYGAGSSIGNAVVIYKGATSPVNVTGLAPNTKYFVYVFAYNGSDGFENYKTTAAPQNPNSQNTTGSYDDDVTYGSNDTRQTSKAIGTNTPIKGTIKSPTDVDWFNFTVTSASPNIRGTLILTGINGNYDVELYNMAGRRIRRGIRTGSSNEAQVINNLPAGTYTVKIMGVGGSYDSSNPYTLEINTKSSEIFSVTK